MPSPAVTYSFSNATTADASQVNQNFTDIINGITDGTKDISVSAGTFAGNVSISGNTTIGNASGDDLTVTASLASTIPIKTTGTYYFGSATKGLLGQYFSNSGSNTSLLQGLSSLAGDVTITLPARTGTVEVVPTISASKTTTYPILTTDDFVRCDASSGSFTTTLPTAVGASGKIYRIKRTDQTLANAVTIATTSSQTIDGVTTRKLMTQYEEYAVISDGANWQVLSHSYPSVWTAYTPTGAFTNTTYTGYWKRVGDAITCRVKAICTGTPAGATFTASIPSGLTIDTAKLVSTGQTANMGICYILDSGTVQLPAFLRYSSTSVVSAAYWDDAAVGVQDTSSVTEAAPFVFGINDVVDLTILLTPITNWEG